MKVEPNGTQGNNGDNNNGEKFLNSKTSVAKARDTGKMANTLAKALAKRYAHRWRFVDFRGPNGEESAGIVDIVAIRKSSTAPTIVGLKKLDLFDIILIQVKGGTAKGPTMEDIARLKLVSKQYDAKAIVLFSWKSKKIAEYRALNDNNEWVGTTAAKLFGKPAKVKRTQAADF
jgi:hypothetical protein